MDPKHDSSDDEAPGPKKGANRITLDLIRKRSEHNEGVVTTMEELTLHQEELVAIDAVLGRTCRKLKILYLQNNIISKMENLHHMKDLEYLNMALNNVPKVEGLGKCEFLKKLDLTINFVDVDELEASMDHLAERIHLRDLYMMGNPAQVDWGGFKNYVIARLPQLDYVDGEEITRGSRILADQQFPKLALELRDLAAAKRAEKAAKAPVDMASLNVDDACAYTPEVRVKMYEEIAEQKAEKEDRQNHMKPKERDFEREQAKAVAKQRAREEAGKIQQCNQGKWEFHWDEESKPGHVVLDVHIQRHLDSTLIDLDVHPHYVSVIIKSKALRLALPAEIRASDSKAARSKTTGHLLVTMPKVDPDAGSMFLAPKSEANDRAGRLNAGAPKAAAASRLLGAPKNAGPKPKDNRSAMPTASIGSIGAMMLDDAKRPKPAELAAVATTRKAAPPPPPPKTECCVDFTAPPAPDDDDDDDEPPPLV